MIVKLVLIVKYTILIPTTETHTVVSVILLVQSCNLTSNPIL